MTRVAVVAHSAKRLGGGLDELRRVLHHRGVRAEWYEVEKSRKAPKRVKRAVENGAELIFVWGGDGMVQRCADAVAGTATRLAILPAGTANLLATYLHIPKSVAGAVAVGLEGPYRRLDLGTVNGEHFAVMAGAGFDAAMIRDADRTLKARIGRAAYIWTGARNLRRTRVQAHIEVDGDTFFDGALTCVLVGNLGALFGGITIFPHARPDDGCLDLAVITAATPVEWGRVAWRTFRNDPARSPFVRVVPARSVSVRLDKPLPYQLDGGDRTRADRLEIAVDPWAVSVCVPSGWVQ